MKQSTLTKPKRKPNALERNKIRSGMVFILPSLILCAMFMLWPLVDVVRYSFTDWNGINAEYNVVGLKNYLNITKIDGFKQMMIATVTYAIGVTILTIIISFITALALDKKGKGRLPRGMMRSFWFLPSLLSGAVVGILWRVMYNYNNGVINKVIVALGGEPVKWLETKIVTNIAVIVGSTWVQIGLCVIVFMAGLQSISQDLYEAASLDGAKPLQQLWHITLPMMASSITINVITTTIAGFKAYELPYNISQGQPNKTTLLMTQRIYFFGFQDFDYGLGSALSVILLIIIALISLIQLIYLKKREDIY